jgi:hypothetical protein
MRESAAYPHQNDTSFVMSIMETQRIIEYLWPEGDDPGGSQVYAILDGARDRRIEAMIRLSGLEYSCLYAGNLSPRLQSAAPYLVHLAPETRFTRELLEWGWGHSWGFFTIVPPNVTLQAHRRHFRTLLRVKDKAGQVLLFRFYDPRVLRVYLPTCTEKEAARFFGPMPRIVVEAEKSDLLINYVQGNTGVRKQMMAL